MIFHPNSQPDNEDAFDSLLVEADWTDMHGGGHHDDECSICRDIAKVRAVFEENRELKAQRSGVQSRGDVIEECAKVAEGTAPVAAGNFFAARRDQCAKIAAKIRSLALSSADRLCSCKASARDGQHMAWCPAISSSTEAK